MLTLLLVAQGVALIVLIARLAPGRTQRPPIEPLTRRWPAAGERARADLNEARACNLASRACMRQGPTVTEILVIDSGSDDGTEKLVWSMGRRTAACA